MHTVRPSSAKPSIRPFSSARQLKLDDVAPSRPLTANAFSTSRTGLPRRSKSPRKELMKALNDIRFAADESSTMPSHDSLIRVFHAKCSQLRVQPTEERRDRFLDIVHRNSTGGRLALPDTGLGPMAGAAVATLLEKEPIFRSVDLAGNSLRDQGAATIANMLHRNDFITSLDLRSNDIGIDGGVALFEALRINNTITELDVGLLPGATRNRIGIQAAEAIAKALTENTTLTSLSVHGNGLGPHGCSIVSAGLSKNTILRCLDLGMNGIQDEGIEALAPALELAALESLNVSHNLIGSKGIRGISNVLRAGNLLLQTLDLSGNDIRPKAAETFADALRSNSLLCTLHLDKNQLGPEGMTGLARGLSCPSLTILTLSSNSFYDRGARVLAENIRGTTSLSKLDLSGNKIGDPGAIALSEVLSSNSSLSILELGDNFIGDLGASSICQSLLSNEHLRNLCLKNNQLHDAAGRAFVHALRTNTSLTQLDMTWNDLNYSNFNAIAQLISEHAAKFRQSAVPRLLRELTRLKREEPKLVVRQTELAEHTDSRQKCLNECARLTKERMALTEQSESGLEELRASFKEAAQELRDKKEEVKNLTAALESEHRKWGAELSSLAMRNQLRKDEIRSMQANLESMIEQVTSEEEELVATETKILEQIQAFNTARQQSQRELFETRRQINFSDLKVDLKSGGSSTMDDGPVPSPKSPLKSVGGTTPSQSSQAASQSRDGNAAMVSPTRPKSAKQKKK